MGTRRSLAIRFLFCTAMMFLHQEVEAIVTVHDPQIVTCGTQSCRMGYVCVTRQSIITKQITYSCEPGPEANASTRCTGPCEDGNPMQYVNGQCTCANSNNQNQNQNQNQGPTCQAQYETLRQQCQEKIDGADSSCDEKNDSGMNSVSSLASQIALLMGQQTSSSIQAACSKMADVSQAANAALAAFRLNCSSSINSCKSSCDDLLSYANANQACLADPTKVSNANSLRSRCNDFDSKVSQATQAIANYGATTANASQCAALTNGTGSPPPEFCKANPTHISCQTPQAMDCTNPQMATNKVCVCSKNPADPMCINEQKVGGEVVQPSLIDSGSRLNNASGDDSGGADIPMTPPIVAGTPGSARGNPTEGAQGSGAGLSSGSTMGPSSAGAGSRSGQNASADKSTDVNGGYYGGGSGTRYGSYGGGSEGGGGYGGRPAASGTTANGSASSGPDLRQFLPGGKYDPRLRHVAGEAGPDGITGPHSNIWQKIQNRYRVVSPTLMP